MNRPRLHFLKDRHKGQRVVLVANGPSLNRMDLRFLKNEVTIGLNKIFLGIRHFGFYPRYYVAVNDKVVQQSAREIRGLTSVKFVSLRNAQLVPEDALTYHIDTSSPSERFCQDISQGVHEGWTVTYAALQIAFFMGFEEVVIIGMDHHYEFQGQPNESKTMTGPDTNHFHQGYFAQGQTWDNPDLKNSEESYRLAREIFTRHGRRIIDATLDGRCQIFEKKSYLDVFHVSQGVLACPR